MPLPRQIPVPHKVQVQALAVPPRRAAGLLARAWMGGLIGLLADAFSASTQRRRQPPG